jgi:hypothetical protein
MRRVLLAISLASTTACFGNPTGPDAAVGTPFQLKAGETVTIPDSARLRFDALRSDSRCPIDAICITAGDAIIAVTLMRRGGNEARELHTMPAQSQLAYSNYVIKLTELQPYPRSDRQARPDDYVATFVVSAR